MQSQFFICFGDQTLVRGVIGKCVFPYSWFSFHFNAVSLAMQKLFILMRSHLFILSFMSLALGDMSVRMLLRGMSDIFLPMFSSWTFMVLRLIFKSFIHLEFIFVYGVSWWSSFIFLHVAFQISQHHLLKKLFLLHFMLLPPCQILTDHKDLGLFLGSLFCSIGLCACFYASTRLFWLEWPCNTVWYQVLKSSYFVLSQNCCSYSGPYKFLKCLFYVCEICHW